MPSFSSIEQQKFGTIEESPMASTSRRNRERSNTTNAGNEGDFKKIIIGICAMQRKANSKPMRSIMNKMVEYYKDYLDFVIFPEEDILNEPVTKWPICECLISFHSTDFPLKKAIEYEKLRRPYVLNDLQRQFDLLDRRKVFKTLARAGIDHPRHCVLMRNEQGELVGDVLHEYTDHIEVNGMVFNKPFVEKPVNAEDHNIHIYFPSSVGGGSQRLFRKINDRSSWYSPVSTVRQEGSYLYEEFIPADGTDVKVYAVGPYYAHAEARKAPGLDGKVERDSDGKEVRYPVILTAKEKTIARRVVLAFGQSVCGFDLLRANGRSYVCDVNGFSFVKTSTKYYEDTAKILGNTILRRLATSLSIPWHIPYQDDDPPLVSTPSGKIMELRCVLAVIRHGDRTPKQKMKVAITDERFFQMFKKYDGVRKREIKMKRPNQLMEVLEIVRQLLSENQDRRQELMDKMVSENNSSEEGTKELERELEKCEDSLKTWEQMRTVLEMYGHFSGINRKVQLKYFKPKGAEKEKNSNKNNNNDGKLSLELNQPQDELQKLANNANSVPPTLLLILKWGGELTTAGVLQAEALGKLFRTLYPGIRRADGKDSPEDTQGLGFLRLHSTFRHDLKIYSSDEGRVQMTAAAFAKGLLALEGELTPILVQMVKSANTDGLLNDDYNARQFQDDIKKYLHSTLQEDRELNPDDYPALNPSGHRSMNNALEFIRNPRKMCHEIAGYVQRMCEIIRWHKLNNTDRTLYLNESWELAERRWTKELREFRKPCKTTGDGYEFDISKIPDIYDNIKYDMEHNPDLCINNEGEFERFYMCVKNMADIVVPQEYGISEESKIGIAQRVCTPLLAKIRNDLHRCIQSSSSEDATDESLTRLDPRASEGIATPMRHVRTRLYFTSESHIHTLVNLIRYGGLCSPDDKKWQRAMNFLSGVTEFNYMTQLVLMVYEDSRTEEELSVDSAKDNLLNNGNGGGNSKRSSKDRFHIELLFSPGLYPCFQTEKERIYESRYSNRHKTSTESKSSTTTAKNKNNSGSGGQIGGKHKHTSSTGTASIENHSDREMSEVIGDTSTAINVASETGAGPSMMNSLSCEVDSGAQSDYSQTSEAPTRKSSTAIQPSPKELSNPQEECSTATNSMAAATICEEAKIMMEEGGKEEKKEREHKESTGSCRQNNETDEDDDDLTEENAVNLVVLDEVSASGAGKGYSKGDLARHSPPGNVLSNSLRKRHATYERNPNKTPGTEDGENGGKKDEEKKNGKGGNEEGESGGNGQRKTSIDEMMRSIFKHPGGGEKQKQNEEKNKLSSGTTTQKTNNSAEKPQQQGNGNNQLSKPIVKSMSDVSCDKKVNQQKQQQQSMDERSPNDDDEEEEECLERIGQLELEVEESQATVGHGRGEWVKQLEEDRKGKKEAQEKSSKEQLVSTKSNKPIEATVPSNTRIPLASIFSNTEQKESEGTMPESKVKFAKQKSEESGGETGGIIFGVKEAKHSEEMSKQSAKIVEKLTMKNNNGGNIGGLQPAKMDNRPSTSTIKDEDDEEQNRAMRRPRFPYRFKHHTVNLLTSGTENKLISTDVLMGKFNDRTKRKASSNSVVLATAVIGRSSSAPRLQTYNAGDELTVNEIRRFWPPLRSLETMHDNLYFKEVDQFLERMMKSSTPLPSPPKTPTQNDNKSLAANLKNLDSKKLRQDNTICRLSPFEH